MNLSEYAEYDAVGLASAIKRKDISASEVTDVAIEAIKKLNPKLNAVVLTNFDNARNYSKDIKSNSALAGVPFLLKDVNQFSHDMPTTFSSKFFMSFFKELSIKGLFAKIFGDAYLKIVVSFPFSDNFDTNSVLKR